MLKYKPFLLLSYVYSAVLFLTLSTFSVLPSWFVFTDTLSVGTQRGFKDQMQLMRVFRVYLFCKKEYHMMLL